MPKAIILMYHNIGIPPKGARIPNLYVTPRMFRFQMGYLKFAGYRVLPIPDLLAAVEAGEPRQNVAAITFDDGFSDFYDNAWPVLNAHGYPSTVYVVSGLVAGHNVWDARHEVIRKPLMSWDRLIEISRKGVQIGSHTRTHPQLTTLSPENLKEELAGSKRELEERLESAVDHFCYPYGDHDDRVKEAVKSAGYRYAVTTQRGHVTKGCDPRALRRIPIKLITNPFSFFYKIHTDSEKRKGRQREQGTM
jgi:peptidoglycan/xylan/chitin deacetylase (PgdA/CDA1 family)